MNVTTIPSEAPTVAIGNTFEVLINLLRQRETADMYIGRKLKELDNFDAGLWGEVAEDRKAFIQTLLTTAQLRKKALESDIYQAARWLLAEEFAEEVAA